MASVRLQYALTRVQYSKSGNIKTFKVLVGKDGKPSKYRAQLLENNKYYVSTSKHYETFEYPKQIALEWVFEELFEFKDPAIIGHVVTRIGPEDTQMAEDNVELEDEEAKTPTPSNKGKKRKDRSPGPVLESDSEESIEFGLNYQVGSQPYSAPSNFVLGVPLEKPGLRSGKRARVKDLGDEKSEPWGKAPQDFSLPETCDGARNFWCAQLSDEDLQEYPEYTRNHLANFRVNASHTCNNINKAVLVSKLTAPTSHITDKDPQILEAIKEFTGKTVALFPILPYETCGNWIRKCEKVSKTITPRTSFAIILPPEDIATKLLDLKVVWKRGPEGFAVLFRKPVINDLLGSICRFRLKNALPCKDELMNLQHSIERRFRNMGKEIVKESITVHEMDESATDLDISVKLKEGSFATFKELDHVTIKDVRYNAIPPTFCIACQGGNHLPKSCPVVNLVKDETAMDIDKVKPNNRKQKQKGRPDTKSSRG